MTCWPGILGASTTQGRGFLLCQVMKWSCTEHTFIDHNHNIMKVSYYYDFIWLPWHLEPPLLWCRWSPSWRRFLVHFPGSCSKKRGLWWTAGEDLENVQNMSHKSEDVSWFAIICICMCVYIYTFVHICLIKNVYTLCMYIVLYLYSAEIWWSSCFKGGAEALHLQMCFRWKGGKMQTRQDKWCGFSTKGEG